MEETRKRTPNEEEREERERDEREKKRKAMEKERKRSMLRVLEKENKTSYYQKYPDLRRMIQFLLEYSDYYICFSYGGKVYSVDALSVSSFTYQEYYTNDELPLPTNQMIGLFLLDKRTTSSYFITRILFDTSIIGKQIIQVQDWTWQLEYNGSLLTSVILRKRKDLFEFDRLTDVLFDLH
jgi:hypothetical protein